MTSSQTKDTIGLLPEMSHEDLMRLKSANIGDICSIKDQLRQARVKVYTTGQYADPRWYANAEAALKHKGRLDQAIALELSARRSQRALQNELKLSTPKPRPVRTLTGIFMEICQEELAETVFEELKAKARARLDNGGVAQWESA